METGQNMVVPELGSLSLSLPSQQHSSNQPGRDAHYETLYLSGLFGIGFGFERRHWQVIPFVSGGVSYYSNVLWSQRLFQSASWDGNSFEVVYEHQLPDRPNTISSFVDFSVMVRLSMKSWLALKYTHHFSPAVKGNYLFYHTKGDYSGTFEIRQREVGLMFLWSPGNKNF